MKKIAVLCLLLPLFFAGISSVHAQGDIVTVQPVHSTTDPCAFNVTISNHNSQGKSIDEVILAISSANIQFVSFTPPAHWTPSINGGSDSAFATSDNPSGIAPNTTMSNFIFSWTGDQSQYDNPYTVTWITLSGGTVLSTGTIQPICTQFQSFDKIDTITQINTSQSGGDPCFTFTMRNQNHQGGAFGSTIDIYNVSFQLENPNGGTLRPSKITPAAGWVLDSVTTYTAYFHTDNNPILAGTSQGGWTICLRANPAVTKFNFVWSAYFDPTLFIDRDTIFNISNTATGSAAEADSVSVNPVSGCLYNITLKNYHLTNQLPPSRIVKFVLRSKTAGVIFTSAPSAPLHWKKTLTNDSIVFLADSLFDGIPDGIVSTNQFSYSVSGPTTSNFIIGWETDHAGNPFPPQVSLLSSGTLTTKCTVATPATDSAFNNPGIDVCTYKLTVANVHNIKPQSNLDTLSISIPANTGQLSGTSGPAGWNWGIPGTTITSKPTSSSDEIVSGSSQDFLYTFSPKSPGTDVTATWTTTDDQGNTTGTGTFKINCTPIVTLCNTFLQTGSPSNDSCVKTFTLHNLKTLSISQLVVSATNGWQIDSASTPALGWTKLKVGKSQVNYTDTSKGGFITDAQEVFNIKFIRYYFDTLTGPPPDAFFVVAVTTDVNGGICTDSLTVTPGCLAIPIHVDTTHTSVRLQSGDIGVTNFTIVPNPTRGSADISFDLNTSERVVISVIDVLGNQITTLNSKMMSEGTYHIPYHLNELPDGTYYIRMQTPLGVITRKLVLTK